MSSHSFNFASFKEEFGGADNDEEIPSSPAAEENGVQENGHENGTLNGSASQEDESENISQETVTVDETTMELSAQPSQESKEEEMESIIEDPEGESEASSVVENQFALPDPCSPSPSYASSSSTSRTTSSSTPNPKCNLKKLIDDGFLLPAQGVLSFSFMGHDFFGDLLPNGYIRHCNQTVTNAEFSSPSLWVNHCRLSISITDRLVGSVWAHVRYKGKRLDSYKLRWYRKQKKPETHSNGNGHSQAAILSELAGQNSFPNLNSGMPQDICQYDVQSYGDLLLQNSQVLEKDTDCVSFSDIKIDELGRVDPSTRVKTETFISRQRMQPFQVQLRTNALLLIDFHTHLSKKTLSGYLAGKWNPVLNQLVIAQACPLMCAPCQDDDNPEAVEQFRIRRDKCINKIKSDMISNNLQLVGWYHSHPNSSPHPTIADIRKQVSYQMSMITDSFGNFDYSPSVALINSPTFGAPDSTESVFQLFWAFPGEIETPGLKGIGRPLQLSYEIVRDAFLTQDLLIGMRVIAAFYQKTDILIDFTTEYSKNTSYKEKLQHSLANKLPMDLIDFQDNDDQADVQMQALQHFWTFVCNLVLPQDSQISDEI